MRRVRLGDAGLESSILGLGCMGMSTFYGPADDALSAAAIRRALDRGVTLLDTADFYRAGHGERLLAETLAGRPGRPVISLKFGFTPRADGTLGAPDGSPEHVVAACEASLERLGVDVIDLYTPARVDPRVPIEETVGAIARLVEQGKVRFVGLSEAGPETLRRAHAEHPVSALQHEYSLFAREAEDALLPLCRELGIGFVASSPLGRGILTGTIRSAAELAGGDIRPGMPWYRPGNLEANLALVDRLGALARQLGVTTAQLALAWVLARGVVAIPGTRHAARVDENVDAAELVLSDADLERIAGAVPARRVAGGRRPDGGPGPADA